MRSRTQNTSCRYSKSESDDKSEEILFDVDINEENEATPKTTINIKLVQLSYNKDEKKVPKNI